MAKPKDIVQFPVQHPSQRRVLPICPGEQIYTEFSYNGSGAPIPAVAPYWWVEQVAANGAIKVSYFSAPILIPPTPTPAFYMQAELRERLAFSKTMPQ